MFFYHKKIKKRKRKSERGEGDMLMCSRHCLALANKILSSQQYGEHAIRISVILIKGMQNMSVLSQLNLQMNSRQEVFQFAG